MPDIHKKFPEWNVQTSNGPLKGLFPKGICLAVVEGVLAPVGASEKAKAFWGMKLFVMGLISLPLTKGLKTMAGGFPFSC